MEGSCGLVQYEEYTACPGAHTRRMVVIPLRAPSATRIQRTLLRLQEQSRTRQWQLQHVCRPLVRWVQKIPAPMTTKSKPVKVPPSEAAFHLSLTLFLKLRSAISLASSEQLIRLSLNWKHVCDNAEW
ncbi:hypothetical protein NC652_000865 [Populus alba x Populus x berolinensis]|nr:hypothetical protein NC652_000865 [Populus alba x Populus x berolinensis]